MNSNRLETLLEMYDNSNHDSFVLFAIAKEYYYQKNNDLAIETFEKLKTIDPKYVGLYYHLAKLYEETFENEKALACYNEGIEQAKKQIELGNQTDFHTLSELMNAKTNFEMEN